MKNYKFSLLESFRFGFYTFIEHFAFFLSLIFTYLGVMALVAAALYGVASIPFINNILHIAKLLDEAGVARTEMAAMVVKQLGTGFIVLMGAASIAVYLFNRYLALGFTKISLDFYDKQSSSIKTLFSCYHLIIKDAVATILYLIICSLAGLFFVIPGIYCAIIFGFYHQFIVDQHVGPLEALKKSVILTQGSRLQIFALWVLFSLLNYATFILFGLTVLISWPLSSLVYAYVYRKLQAASPSHQSFNTTHAYN